MPYSNCLDCKKKGRKTRLDVPTQGHYKYCKSCLLKRKSDKILEQIQDFTDFVRQL